MRCSMQCKNIEVEKDCNQLFFIKWQVDVANVRIMMIVPDNEWHIV